MKYRIRRLFLIVGVVVFIFMVLVVILGVTMKSSVTDYNDYEGISMAVEDGSLSSKGITVVVHNETDNELVFSEYYLLEKKIWGRWHKVKYKAVMMFMNVSWDDIGLLVLPNSKSSFDVDWDWLYGELKSGEYRIIKHFTIDHPNEYNLVAEFRIH